MQPNRIDDPGHSDLRQHAIPPAKTGQIVCYKTRTYLVSPTPAKSALDTKAPVALPQARACSTLNLRTGIAFCPTWMRRSYASRRALDETGAADRDMPPQGQDPAPGSAAHDFGHCLAASERGQVARHPG